MNSQDQLAIGEQANMPIPNMPENAEASGSGEMLPLLPGAQKAKKKHWYRARPLWLVPFAVSAALARGMTLAPRVSVFTELACERLRPIYFNHTTLLHSASATAYPYTAYKLDLPSILLGPSNSTDDNPEDGEDMPPISSLPSKECIKDKTVQAGAARLQTIMTTTMGLLSALTTGAWGRFGERHGRTKVMTLAVTGLLFTDLMFFFAASKILGLGKHRYALILLAPIVEGMLGGYSTLQATTTAYVSDCTSDGSRANIFSRFHGVFFIGIAVGPEIAALLIRSSGNTTTVFIVSAALGTTNLFLSLFVFPESLTKARREEFIARRAAEELALPASRSMFSYPMRIISPLGVFLPRKRENRKGLDWNFPLLAGSMFFMLLTIGMYQTKYLYATTTYGWGAESLSYYITAMGTSRALHLLVFLPYIMRTFKPVVTAAMRASPEFPRILAKEMQFDLTVAKVSLLLDIMSHSLVAILNPNYMELFVFASSLTSLGGGLLPSLQSLALCVRQAHGDTTGVGELFGAIAFLQAVASNILGPLLFGVVFSETVAVYSKSVFVLAAFLLCISFTLLSYLKPNRRLEAILREEAEQNRGRSRASKALTVSEEG